MILNIIVNYYNESDVINYLNDINNQKNLPTLKVLLVDNSQSFSKKKILNSFNNFEIIFLNPKTNLGYYGAAKYGYDYYCENFPTPDVTIISNTDIQFLDGFFFSKLEKIYNEDKETILSPLVLRGKVKREWFAHTVSRPTIKRVKFLKFLLDYKLSSYAYNYLSLYKQLLTDLLIQFAKKLGYQINYTKNSKFIYAPNGAFTILPRSFFDRGGSLKLFCFLYGEEIFIAEQAIRLNLKIQYNINLKLLHSGNATLNIHNNKKILLWKKDAVNCYFKKYFL
jgi:GT2 family glycosyltransferase